jgi:hypothetical protein
MKKQLFSLFFAVLIVFASVSLRKAFANAESSAALWNGSNANLTQPATLQAHPLPIGVSPVPTAASIGSSPVPPFRTLTASIGSSPMPPFRTLTASIGSSPMPPFRTLTASIGSSPVPPFRTLGDNGVITTV